MSERYSVSLDHQISQSRTIKHLKANNAQLRSALEKCLLVLAGEDLNKGCLISTLEAGRDALKNKREQGANG